MDSAYDAEPKPTDQPWFKSSFSGSNGCCVEVSITDGHILVRDSKANRVDGQPVLSYLPAEWAAFVAGVKAGQFDL